MVVKNEIIKLVYSESHEILTNFKKSTKTNFFQTLASWEPNCKTLKNDAVNKHIPVLDIAKNKSALISGIAEIRP